MLQPWNGGRGGYNARRVAAASQKTGSADPIALIVKVKELAKEAGAVENLMSLVGVLAD